MPDWNQTQVQEAFVLFINKVKHDYSISQEGMANQCNIHKDTLGNILTGKTTPAANTRKRLFTGIAAIINKEKAIPADKKISWLTVQDMFEQSLNSNSAGVVNDSESFVTVTDFKKKLPFLLARNKQYNDETKLAIVLGLALNNAGKASVIEDWMSGGDHQTAAQIPVIHYLEIQKTYGLLTSNAKGETINTGDLLFREGSDEEFKDWCLSYPTVANEKTAYISTINESKISNHGLVVQKNNDDYIGEMLYTTSLDRHNRYPHVIPADQGMLPPCPSLIIGREDDFSELKRRFGLTGEAAHPYTVVRGLPGVGKTTIAFALAHDEHIKTAFPDGVLWTHLDIVSREARNREQEQTQLISKLADWARVLGSNEVRLSRKPEEAAGLLRSLLHKKRMLLIVDDVWDSAHGEIFKVGGPECVTLFTARETRIADELVDSPADDVYLLGKLSDDKAHDLLQILAPSVVNDYPEQCLELIHELEGLPLSLQVAGRLLNREAAKGFSPTDLINALKQGVALLQAKAPANRPGTEEDRTLLTVTVLLQKSTSRLSKEVRIRFASLGPLAPKPATFDIRAMQAVWVDDHPKPTVDELLDRGLLEPVTMEGINRYQMHALLVMHAKDLLQAL